MGGIYKLESDYESIDINNEIQFSMELVSSSRHPRIKVWMEVISQGVMY